MNKQKTYDKRIIGLDCHPDVCTLAAVCSNTKKTIFIKDRVATTTINKWAKKHLSSSDLVVLEASGNSFAVVALLAKAGIKALVLESKQAGAIKENYCNDDKSSAVKLAHTYLSGLAKEVWTPDRETISKREVFYCYNRARKDSTRSRNRIRSFLNEHAVRLPTGTSLVKDNTLALVKSLYEWNPTQKLILSDLFQSLHHNETRRKQMNLYMKEEVLRNSTMRRLLRIKGINYITAFSLIAFIGDISRFATPKKLSGYLGLCPRKTQSGNNQEGRRGGVGKTGQKHLRSLLIQCAQSIFNTRNSILHQWGLRLFFKKGNRNYVVSALARKLTVRIWYCLNGQMTSTDESASSLKIKLGKILSGLKKSDLPELNKQTKKELITYYSNLLLTTP